MTPAAAFDALARAIFRQRWPVLVGCVAIALLGAWAGLGVERKLYGSTAEIAGAPSQRVAEALRSEFQAPFGPLMVVTFQAKKLTVDDPGFRRALDATAQALRESTVVKRVVSPAGSRDRRLRSADGHTAAILVGLASPSAQEAERATPAIRAAIRAPAETLKQADPTASYAVTGAGPLAYDLARYGAEDGARAEGRVLPVTLGILLLAFGALTAAAIPLVMGVLATAAAMGLIALVASHWPLAIVVQNVATMLGLAVGIDYALLVIGRFREALGRGAGTEDALAESMRTAGVAVAGSGLTVMIGLAGLIFTPSLNTRSIGVGGALVLAAGVLMALTLLPALLAILGPSIDAPALIRLRLRGLDAGRRWGGWAGWVCQHAKPLAAAGLLLLALAAAPIATLRTDYGASSLLPRYELEFQRGLDMLASLGRKNAYAPIDLLVTADTGAILQPGSLDAQATLYTPGNLDGLLALSRRLREDPRVLEVLSPVDLRPGLPADHYRRLYRHWRGARRLAPDRFDAFVSRDGKRALVQVIAVDDLRFEAIQVLARDLAEAPQPAGLQVVVGGQAALYNDTHQAVVASAPGLFAFVIGATFLTLALIYRSLLVPLKATLLNLLSVGAGVGALVVLFQWGWGMGLLGLQEPTGGLPPAILATIFCIVFGLSMDYEVFLISRIKEAYDATGDNALATEEGLAATGGVITAAALIMATVFAGFAGMKLVMVQMLGVGLAVAVLVDATVVRVLLAPALMRLAGDWNWWPGHRPRP